MSFLYQRDYFLMARYFQLKIEKDFGCYISPAAEIDSTVEFIHPVGVVVGAGVKLGPQVKVYQNVTFGGARRGDMESGNYPEVRKGAVIFAGAKVVGRITIYEYSTVGANAVVISDVPERTVVVGVPAKILTK
jgi:serine O-acetyltransferase